MAEEKTTGFTTREALFYHETIRPGKIEIIASKPMATQRDLSLAYSPGVAATRSLKARWKWLWSAKPSCRAASAMVVP